MSETHDPWLTFPRTYNVQYRCSCGWVSDEKPSEELGSIGAQLVRHMSKGSAA